jgi:hypothetical protein
MVLSLDAGDLRRKLSDLLASRATSLRDDLKLYAAEKGVQV